MVFPVSQGLSCSSPARARADHRARRARAIRSTDAVAGCRLPHCAVSSSESNLIVHERGALLEDRRISLQVGLVEKGVEVRGRNGVRILSNCVGSRDVLSPTGRQPPLYAGAPAEGNYPLEQLSHAFRLRSALSDPALRSPFEVHENAVAVSEYEHSLWNLTPTRANVVTKHPGGRQRQQPSQRPGH